MFNGSAPSPVGTFDMRTWPDVLRGAVFDVRRGCCAPLAGRSCWLYIFSDSHRRLLYLRPFGGSSLCQMKLNVWWRICI